MRLESTLIVVKDIDVSVEFYKNLLGLDVTADFGANKTLTGGLVLQSLDSWRGFIDTDRIEFGGNCSELYFETDDFDGFAEKLKRTKVNYLHPVKEHSWGQRVVRFYDPDGHIIEVGENIINVCQRFADSGMTAEQVAARMDVPIDFVISCIN